MKLIKYDSKADAVYISVSSKKSLHSLEISPRIVVDLSDSNRVIGVEILEASKFLSELFGSRLGKKDLEKLNCMVNERKELLLQFQLGNRHQSLVLPKAYESPVLS